MKLIQLPLRKPFEQRTKTKNWKKITALETWKKEEGERTG